MPGARFFFLSHILPIVLPDGSFDRAEVLEEAPAVAPPLLYPCSRNRWSALA